MDLSFEWLVWDSSFKWLVWEGVLPLVGTALLYWVMQGCFRIAQAPSFTFKWSEAIDSLGWLYGAAVLAIQAGVKGWDLKAMGPVPALSWGIAFACSMLLIAAICSKAADPNWKPGRPMKVAATILTIAVLWAGFRTQNVICCTVGGPL
ncbi:hypothetical protein P0Y43_16465 [Pseudomonas entomophila]|uniref:hypothetical protein n=1 Tax=Pseudomonas entomophila TaxID=312306 RepID=UPI0023D7D495|nr:hypothetical protein [Pseudomonas entomophila]MDF0732306.1 hypothetical protein [Pseudomonas entomophila]